MRLAAIFFLTLVLAPTAVAAQRQAGLESSLARQINAIRREHGLKPLNISTKLAAAAAQHTQEMGADGYFDHDSHDGTAFWTRIEHWYSSTGYGSWAVGENILYSSPDASSSSTVSNWMSSAPHRANLLSRSWREIGIAAIHFDSAPGMYGGQPVTIVTADFGARR